MVTTPTNPTRELAGQSGAPAWPAKQSVPTAEYEGPRGNRRESRPAAIDALQSLLAFSAMHQQVRRRRALAIRRPGFETIARSAEFEPEEQFVLDEVLQLVAERAIAITGADGLGIALAENNEIVLRASAGIIKPDVGARIERDSAFSGACFRTAQIIRCDDTETDDRVNLNACRRMGARSMVAVPLCGRRRVIGLLEAFSADPFGFNDSDVSSLELLAELILGALKPEDEDRFAESAQAAEAELAGRAVTSEIASPAKLSPEKVSPEKIPPAIASQPANAVPSQTKPIPAVAKPIAPPTLSTLTFATSQITSQVASQVALQVPSATEVPAFSPSAKSVAEREPSAGRHPGVMLVFALVVIAALLAGGVWWKLKNAQLENALLQPDQTSSTSQPAPATTTSPETPPAAARPDEQANSAAHVDATHADASAGLDNSDASPSGNAPPQDPSKMPRITGIRHWSSADTSTVVLDLEDQVQYEAHRLSGPDRIYFDLHDTSLAREIEGKSIDIGDALLSRVRVAQPASGLTRVVLETRGNSNYSVSLEPNPYRLVVHVNKLGADAKEKVVLFPGAAEANKLAIVVPPPTREDLQWRARVPKMRIVVDAGHGGWDLGTVGKRGLLEKDLVLEVAERLGKLLESRLGAEVILTRHDDSYIPLDERAGMANQSQADLFVSVHANYSDLPSARGVETYYTNFFSAPNAKDLESRQPDRGKNSAPAVLSPAELHDKIEQSRRLAASVQRSLYGTLAAENPGLRNRGVKEASYVVLTETSMPGILAEVSFVSSPADEQKLRNDGYREQIAEALYKGIARYAAGSHGVKMASAKK